MENNIDKLEELIYRKPFRVPEGYFENFTKKMTSQLPDKRRIKKGEKVRLFERMRPWRSIAAIFFGFMMVVFVFWKKKDMYTDKNMIVKNISLQTVSKLDKDSYSNADFFDYLAEEYSNDNVEYFMDNLVN
jgi:hypothetical protein